MQTEEVGLYEGLLATLEFDCSVAGVLDRAIFNTKVKACIEPQVRAGILKGKDTLLDVVIIVYHPDRPEELGRKIVNIVAEWQAHYPWWSDHPDWTKAPTVKAPPPVEVTHIT